MCVWFRKNIRIANIIVDTKNIKKCRYNNKRYFNNFQYLKYNLIINIIL